LLFGGLVRRLGGLARTKKAGSSTHKRRTGNRSYWSRHGINSWSNEHWRKMGKIGQYGYRTIWRRLGMTMKLRDRVYEISGTDPVKIAIMGAELQVSRTNA